MSQPFARARLMFAAIAAAMQLDGAAKHLELSRISPYKSRGKGKGRAQASSRVVAHDKRAAKKARNVKRHRAACRG